MLVDICCIDEVTFNFAAVEFVDPSASKDWTGGTALSVVEDELANAGSETIAKLAVYMLC